MKHAFVFVAATLLGVSQAGQAAAELCGDAAPDSGFAVDRVWPRDCATDSPLDALAVVSGPAARLALPTGAGSLAVTVMRVDDGALLPGTIEFVQGGGVALWRGAQPFAPHTAYTLTAHRVDANGAPGGEGRGAYFVTGESTLQPISAQGELAVGSRQLVLPQRACEFDACGESDCVDGEGTAARARVSIHVPPIDGGLPAAQGHTFDGRYDVVAVFGEARGHIFASTKQSLERLTEHTIELDIPVLPEAFEGCAQVTVADLTGATLELPATCLTIAPEGESTEYARDLDAVSDGDERLDASQRAAGCDAGPLGRANLPLMLAALLLLVARRRLPF